MGRPPSLNITLRLFVLDTSFSVAIVVAYLWAAERLAPGIVSQLGLPLAVLHVAKAGLLLTLIPRSLRPIDRWWRQHAAGVPDGENIRRALAAARPAPMRFAVWLAAAWVLIYPGALFVTGLQRGLPDELVRGTVMVAVGVLFAAAGLAYTVAGALLSREAGKASLDAYRAGVSVSSNRTTFSLRLVVPGCALGLAPTFWMGALAAFGGFSTAELVAWSAIALVWVPLCAWFLLGVLAYPINRIASTVAGISDSEDLTPDRRLPVFSSDELGDLAKSVNRMLDRLALAADKEVRDRVSLRELASLALRRASEMHAVLENMVDAVFVCDASGRLTITNAAAWRMLGLSGPPASQPTFERLAEKHRLSTLDGRLLPPGQLPLARAMRGELVARTDVLATIPGTDRQVVLNISASPVRDDAGRIVGAISVARDLTAERDLERLKDEFLRVAAHELKTPVTITKGYVQLLLREDLPPQRRNMLAAVERGANRIHRIVEDLLDISQVQMGRLEVISEPVDLTALVRERLELIGHSRPEGTLRLVREEPAVVEADPLRLGRVISGLLDNALKASPGGGPIDVSVSREGGEAVVAVHDRGIGIPAAMQPHVFERFFRAHSGGPYDFGGLGVGLHLSRAIVERLHGRMWFESEEGRGSTFAFALPLKEDRA